MEHNLFKFTLRTRFDPDEPVSSQIIDYLAYVTENLDNDSAKIDDIFIVSYERDMALTYVKLCVSDYGVAQMGVDIVNLWMHKIFTGPPEFGITVDAIVAHPLANVATGALIEWDGTTDTPKITELE